MATAARKPSAKRLLTLNSDGFSRVGSDGADGLEPRLRRLFELFEGHDAQQEILRLKAEGDGF